MTIEIDHIGLSRLRLRGGEEILCRGAGAAPHRASSWSFRRDVAGGEPAAGLGADGKPFLWISGGGKTSPHTHIAFRAENRAQVDAFYKAAIAAGGKDNGGPGIREHVSPELLRRLRARCRRPQHRGLLPPSGIGGSTPRAGQEGDRMMGDASGGRITGGCQCGAVRYALHAVPTDPHICHCRMCQKAFGSFFAPLAGVPLDKFELTRGALATFRSSDPTERGFCRDCGTPLTFRYVDRQRICRLDRLARRTGEDPAAHISTASKGGCRGSATSRAAGRGDHRGGRCRARPAHRRDQPPASRPRHRDLAGRRPEGGRFHG